MATGSITLHRVLRAPAERVYRAFLDPAAICKWMPPNGFTCTVHELDPREGGRFHMAYTQLATGASHAFGGRYVELVPGKRIVNTDRFDDAQLDGEMRTTVSLREVSCGTELHITQEGIPAQIPLEACHVGWQESLALLALLVEAEIPAEEGNA